MLLGVACGCGHQTRARPWRAAPDSLLWDGVELTAWRLVGPRLAAMIVLLALRMRLPDERRVQRLSTGGDRLRCRAHLACKLRGLAESTDGRVAVIGVGLGGHFLVLRWAVYEAREGPP